LGTFQQLQLKLSKLEKLQCNLDENKISWINRKHFGKIHQFNQMLAIYNSFMQLWATSNNLVHSWAI